mmetsp:Transcript_19250/g.61267  ORF Transcript_19250/g.61267 Transcript_19250/m.61267 type:complete len:203 (-) Transcript_19250:1689-2297(-)
MEPWCPSRVCSKPLPMCHTRTTPCLPPAACVPAKSHSSNTRIASTGAPASTVWTHSKLCSHDQSLTMPSEDPVNSCFRPSATSMHETVFVWPVSLACCIGSVLAPPPPPRPHRAQMRRGAAPCRKPRRARCIRSRRRPTRRRHRHHRWPPGATRAPPTPPSSASARARRGATRRTRLPPATTPREGRTRRCRAARPTCSSRR